MCASVAPELFEVAEDNSRIIVRQEKVPSELVDQAVNAEVCCPVEAIRVISG